MDLASTILAVASPPGRSARAILRISGEQAIELIRPHIASNQGGDGGFSPNCNVGASLCDLLPGSLPILACFFNAPRSFTGQDSLEIQMPGNPALLERVVDALLQSGRRRAIDVRRAQPGEFTARAFFLGKLSLIEAEGVAAIISAQSDAELRAARITRSGALGAFAHDLADRLAAALALVEAGIDFTDQEDVVPIAAAELRDLLCALREQVQRQLDRSIGAEQLQAIPWVVLTGPANAGKSTLFNALLGRERAVVSMVAGTTRDVLAEPLALDTEHGRAELMLVDLAGADDALDPLNQRMQAAGAAALERAELVLLCIPADEPLPGAIPDRTVIVRTKADQMPPEACPAGDVILSVRDAQTLDRLRTLLAERLSDRAVSLASDLMVLRPRHEAALHSALGHLKAAIRSLQQAAPRQIPDPEITAASMRAALDDLAALAGDITPEEILGRIFATFCVGK